MGWSKEVQLKYPEGWKKTREKFVMARVGITPINKGKTGLQQSKYKGKKLPWIGHFIPHTKATKKKIAEAKRQNADKKWKSEVHSEVDNLKRSVRRGDIKRATICEGCGRKCNQKKVKDQICIDHDHKTGQVRGWLCQNCNRALGLLKDNPKSLINLANYIKLWRKK